MSDPVRQLEIIRELSHEMTEIIHRSRLNGLKYGLDWGGNGVGDRWANKR
uniref:Uncharacterized protein n=1 Tax=viral metagenome TaxID=1070528 RepID=A0A6C0BLW0_9ZZZZ